MFNILDFIKGAEITTAAYKPKKTYSGSLPTGTVKKGSKGTDVKRVQTFLNWCIKAGLKVDGIAGIKTVAAIKKYQKRYGLKVDGIFGTKSLAKAKSIVAKYKTSNTTNKTTVVTNGKKIGNKANELAYTNNTKAANYPSGKPTDAYKAALSKAYPDRSKWSAAPRKGASCDVFVGTCVRNSGVDKDFPRGLDEQIKYLAKSDKFKEVSVNKKTVQDGDIIVYSKKSGAHICIVYDGKIKEAGYKHYYPKTTNYLSARLAKTGKKWLKVYRAK